MPRIVISEPNKPDQPYRIGLEHKSLEIGRAENADLKIDEPSVSLKHCRLVRVPGGYFLEDQGSTNGIKKNGQRLPQISLTSDESITLSDEVQFHFKLSDEEIAELASEGPQPVAETVRLDEKPLDTAPLPFPNARSTEVQSEPVVEIPAAPTPKASTVRSTAPQMAKPQLATPQQANTAAAALPQRKKANPVLKLINFVVAACFAVTALTAGYLARYYKEEIAPRYEENSTPESTENK